MSGIGGIFNFDGTPVGDRILTALRQGLAARGPDDGNYIAAGSVGMVYRAFHTNRESRLEKQPLISRYGHILCWDGRLDNREELIALLSDELRDDHTDVAIVMAGYLKWGRNCFSRIIGDFAFALWDPVERTLSLARDVIGPRPLYYHADEKRIVWSTDLASILGIAGTQLQINDEYVADFLVGLPEPGQTPYRNISAVLPAHVLTVSSSKLELHQFWKLNFDREIHYRTDIEYEEHFRHLFRDAVRCRLRADKPVWSELSGGMDSSSIVCMATDIISKGESQTESLETVSRVFDEFQKSDERKYIVPVEEKIGKRGLHLREDDYRIMASWPTEYVPTIPTYEANVAAYYKEVRQAMHKTGSRVLLSGHGGDNVLMGDGSPFTELGELLMQGKFLSLHRRLRAWTGALNKPYFPFLKRIVRPLLPQSIQSSRNRPAGKVLRLFNRDFVKRMELSRRMLAPFNMSGTLHPGRRYQMTCFSIIQKQLSVDFRQELCGAEISYPFTHRPLIEFLFAIPIEQRVRPKQSKSILRRALRDLLPLELVNRQQARITIWDAVRGTVRREGSRMQQLFRSAPESINNYVNIAAVLEACDQNHENFDPYVISLIPFALWLEAVEQRQRKSHVERVPSISPVMPGRPEVRAAGAGMS
jgi:asparagine synthase (glutamine-hydrolysing)